MVFGVNCLANGRRYEVTWHEGNTKRHLSSFALNMLHVYTLFIHSNLNLLLKVLSLANINRNNMIDFKYHSHVFTRWPRII